MRILKPIMAAALARLRLIALTVVPRSITQVAPNAVCMWIDPADSAPHN